MESIPGNNHSNFQSDAPIAGVLPSAGGSALGNATATVHSAIDEAAHKAQPVIDRVASMAHQATDKVSNAGEQTADWVSQQSENLVVTQKVMVDAACKYISANPLKAVGIALVAGLVISRTMR
jgi:ElaB protein